MDILFASDDISSTISFSAKLFIFVAVLQAAMVKYRGVAAKDGTITTLTARPKDWI